MFSKICSRAIITLFRNSELQFAYKLRSQAYKHLLKSCGRNFKIAPHVYLHNPENIEIGNDVSIQHFCLISGKGGITIGNDVSIAPYTSFYSSSHPINNRNTNIRNTKLEYRKIKLGNNIWIGASSIILYGVEIADGVIVGAHSTITKPLAEKDSVYVGSPAKKIKSRFE